MVAWVGWAGVGWVVWGCRLLLSLHPHLPLPPPPPTHTPTHRYPLPAAILSVGVHCADRNACAQPALLPRRPTPADAPPANSTCQPSWWCCDWHNGLSAKTPLTLTEATDDVKGFLAVAPNGSWVADLHAAGHM